MADDQEFERFEKAMKALVLDALVKKGIEGDAVKNMAIPVDRKFAKRGPPPDERSYNKSVTIRVNDKAWSDFSEACLAIQIPPSMFIRLACNSLVELRRKGSKDAA